MLRWMKSAVTIVAAQSILFCNCLLMKTIRDKKQLNRKEGTAMMKGAWTPPKMTSTRKSPQPEAQEV